MTESQPSFNRQRALEEIERNVREGRVDMTASAQALNELKAAADLAKQRAAEEALAAEAEVLYIEVNEAAVALRALEAIEGRR